MQSFIEYLQERTTIKLQRAANADTTDQFVTDFYRKGTKTRSGVKILGAYIELLPFANVVQVSEISIPNDKQGKGLGHRVMRILTGFADERLVSLRLHPNPIDQGINKSQIPKRKLIEFYKKHGFTNKGNVMEREPRRK